MKSILKVISVFSIVLVGFVLFGNLIYSAVTGTPISELLSWEWWVLFLTADIWFTQQLARLSENKNSSAE
jgi:hypothetical protein